MKSKAKIVVVGSHAPGIFVRVKRIPKAGETVIGWDLHEPLDGGKGSNQAIAAARLGVETSFVGCLGRDRIGDEGERVLREAHVDTTWMNRHESVHSGGGLIMLDENGVPAMITSMGANDELTEEDVEMALSASAPEAKVMLTQFEIPVDVALYAARRASQLGMISILNPAPAPEMVDFDLDGVGILIPNQTESQGLLGQAPGEDYDATTLVKELKNKYHIPAVIVTLGENGFVGIDDNGTWSQRAPKVDVQDTSGAGDSFCASLAVAISNGKSIREASIWANHVAGLSVTRPGTIGSFPTLDEANYERYPPSEIPGHSNVGEAEIRGEIQ